MICDLLIWKVWNKLCKKKEVYQTQSTGVVSKSAASSGKKEPPQTTSFVEDKSVVEEDKSTLKNVVEDGGTCGDKENFEFSDENNTVWMNPLRKAMLLHRENRPKRPEL